MALTLDGDPDSYIKDMWLRFRETTDPALRNQLLLHYSPLVKFVASRLAAGLPHNVEQTDLVNYGIFGLADAIDRFEVERGNKFETYAMQRIRGAIFDGLRSYDWVPRSVRAKARNLDKVISKLEGDLGRAPSETEVAAEMNIPVSTLRTMLSQIAATGVIALDEILGVGPDRADGVTLGETIADSGDGPAGLFERQEMRFLLADAINSMSDREKWVLLLYYYEHFTLAQIGNVLNVTESRVCQIHTKAVVQLRNYIQRRSLEPAYG